MSFSIENAECLIANWAKGNCVVQAVWFFGSRVTGCNAEDSDLDVAIELVFSEFETALAHFHLEQDQWQAELARKIPWRLDLQLYHVPTTTIVSKGLRDGCLEVYRRELQLGE